MAARKGKKRKCERARNSKVRLSQRQEISDKISILHPQTVLPKVTQQELGTNRTARYKKEVKRADTLPYLQKCRCTRSDKARRFARIARQTKKNKARGIHKKAKNTFDLEHKVRSKAMRFSESGCNFYSSYTYAAGGGDTKSGAKSLHLEIFYFFMLWCGGREDFVVRQTPQLSPRSRTLIHNPPPSFRSILSFFSEFLPFLSVLSFRMRDRS